MIPIKILDEFVLKVMWNNKHGRRKKRWKEEGGLGYKIIEHITKILQLKQYDNGARIDR